MAGEIDEDRDALKRIMDRLDVSPAPVKAALAWAAEKAGRVKPNGQLRGYSPLGRVVEIEALITGVSGKLSLWRALKQIAPSEPRARRRAARGPRRARRGPARAPARAARPRRGGRLRLDG